MDLPKDIIQIGEFNANCKVYVEDYVVSFLKQQNRNAADKNVAVALYGTSRTEGGKSYVFVYGAAVVKSLEKETRHLSQAQMQEMEKIRKQFFAEQELTGYRILNGDMIEGMHIREKDTFRYIGGFAQFYEKNEVMLAYMLDYNGNNAQPEVVDQEKYDMVKKRQEERRQQSGENRRKIRIHKEEELPAQNDMQEEVPEEGIGTGERDALKEAWTGVFNKQRRGLHRMQAATVAVFAVLCVAGVYSVSGNEGMERMVTSWNRVVSGFFEKKLPDELPVSGPAEVQESKSILRAEDNLNEALLEENAKKTEEANSKSVKSGANARDGGQTKQETGALEVSAMEEAPRSEGTSGSAETKEEEEGGKAQDETEEKGQVDDVVDVVAENDWSDEELYTIQKGDTLIGISLRVYGNADMVERICLENYIQNPDDIKEGQEISLP